MTKLELIAKTQDYINGIDQHHNTDTQFIYDLFSDLKQLNEPKECEFNLIDNEENNACLCSNCGFISEDNSGDYGWNYCPNCGAKVKGGVK